MVDKIPPHNLEAEKSVVGAVLIDRDAVVKVADFLKKEHFYEDKHGHIYQAAVDLFLSGSPIDLVTMAGYLRKKKKLKTIGGRAYLSELVSFVPSSAHIEEYAKQVREAAVRRGLISAGGKISELAFDEVAATTDVLADAQKLLFNVSTQGIERGFVDIQNILEEAYEESAKVAADKGLSVGLSTGFNAIDNILGGFQPSDLVILAGRPSMGKTSLGLDLALNTALGSKAKIAFFSLEMSKMQLMTRMLATKSGVGIWELRTGRLKDEEFAQVGDAVGELSEAKIWIDDQPGQNIIDIRTKARRLFLEQGLDLVIVDYLQLIHGNRRESRVMEVSEISMELKNMARELDVPVLALSQLSRRVEERVDRIPQLSDLRDSGSIEQDADVVMFIHREDYYDPETERAGISDIIVAKHRNGPTGKVELVFIKERASFKDLVKEKEGKKKKG